MRYLIIVNLIVLMLSASSLTGAATPLFSATSLPLIAPVHTNRVNASSEMQNFRPQEKPDHLITNHTRNEWHLHISSHQVIEYLSLYPGVDRIFHSPQQQLESDLKEALGANSIVIQQITEKIKDLSTNTLTYLSGPAGDDNRVQLSPMTYQEFESLKQVIIDQLSFNRQKPRGLSNRSKR